MAATSSIPMEILASYAEGAEAERLGRGIGPLERARTQELIARHLPAHPAVICDVGAGPGAYSFWLAARGHTVHMVDPVPKHIEQARDRAGGTERGIPASMVVGDARDLPFAGASADAVILHGPLYHLCDRQDRLVALREARRVLCPGGLLLAFGITRYASTILGLTKGWVWDQDYLSMCREELMTGQHRRPPTWPQLFTTAYFHHVDELRDEIVAAGFDHGGTFGVEGPVWMVPDFEPSWKDEARREILLNLAGSMEREPALSPHVMALAHTRS